MTSGTAPSGSTREAERFHLHGDDGSATVRKLVSKGERLAIDADGDGIKLDALLLECLTWQSDRGAIHDVLGASFDDPLPASDVSPVANAPDISISNEYSRAVVSKVTTDAGDGLLVRAPARGTDITPGVPTLRALAGLDDTFAFSEWFKTPFGPEDAPLEGPL